MKYILYNSKSNNSNNEQVVNAIAEKLGGEVTKKSVLDINYPEFFAGLNNEDEITLIGGDGTLNHFINDTKELELPCDVYFCGGGTGNDFMNDVKDKVVEDRVLINEYVKNLPTVTVNGKDYLFINGVGFGIDGYCCEVADKIAAEQPGKKIDYTGIAIKGLLFHYKRPNAKVTVDGVTKEYKKVYLAPTMKGRYYGGGMIVAPSQDRNSEEHNVTTVVMYGKGRIPTLMVFPKIFKGEHVKHTNMVEVLSGHEVEVEFDIPTALQIDGETIVGVTKYKVTAK